MALRFKSRALCFVLGFAAVTLSTGCNSGGDGSDTQDYSGIWDVRYVFSVDDCQIALAGISGFLDQHTIEQSGAALNLSSRSGFFNVTPAEVGADGSFSAQQVSEGDIFGAGVFCQLVSGVAYEAPNAGESQSLFTQTITCDDGYTCETLARGTAVRQPS